MSNPGSLLQVDEKELYEHDFGRMEITAPGRQDGEDDDANDLPRGRDIPAGGAKIHAAEDAEASSPKKTGRKGKYDGDDDADEENYSAAFSISLSGVYFDEKDMSLKVEYKLLREEDAHESGMNVLNVQAAQAASRETEDAGKDDSFSMNAAASVYTTHSPIEKFAENVLGSEVKATYDAGVLNIEYKDVELINGQKTYQRVVLQADKNGESLYNLTMRKLGGAGMGATAEYDDDFGSMLITSINGKEEGTDGNFNEFYLNGEIGKKAVNEQALKEGDWIEWRYAKETDGTCGGSPDFNALKSIAQYSAVAMLQAQQFGLLPERSHFPQPGNGYGTLIFH